VEYGTRDTEFGLRAERSLWKTDRVHTVTCRATDVAGNFVEQSAAATAPNPAWWFRLFLEWLRVRGIAIPPGGACDRDDEHGCWRHSHEH
jgi:hypothetical protein